MSHTIKLVRREGEYDRGAARGKTARPVQWTGRGFCKQMVAGKRFLMPC